jgi:hypothetical protein
VVRFYTHRTVGLIENRPVFRYLSGTQPAIRWLHVPNTALTPSLLDDDEFLTELEKLGTESAVPPPAEPAGFWAPGARTPRYVAGAAVEAADMVGHEDLDDLRALYSSDASGAAATFHAGSPAEDGSTYGKPLARAASRVHQERAIPPARLSPEEREPEPQSVSRFVVVLVLLTCAGFGAGAAGFLFLDRVTQITRLWLG